MTAAFRSLALALVLSGVGVAADAALKLASSRPHPFLTGWFALGCLLTAAFAVGWVFLMQSMKIATAGIVYAVASALLLYWSAWSFSTSSSPRAS